MPFIASGSIDTTADDFLQRSLKPDIQERRCCENGATVALLRDRQNVTIEQFAGFMAAKGRHVSHFVAA
jgi:hypothetical protein